jgi:hypothetical protein
MEIVHVIRIMFQLPLETTVPLIRIMSYDVFPENNKNKKMISSVVSNL